MVPSAMLEEVVCIWVPGISLARERDTGKNWRRDVANAVGVPTPNSTPTPSVIYSFYNQ
jgi:hypothetical protein